MDHHELQEEEIFEDYTTASEWERFTVNLEQFLNEWQGRPMEPENINQKWGCSEHTITFYDHAFKFSYYKKITSTVDPMTVSTQSVSTTSTFDQFPSYLQSALSKENDVFPPKYCPNNVAQFFDVKEFAVLTANTEPLQNESKLKALLSSACMALNNTNSTFPIFVQYHNWNQHFYCGIAESQGIRTSMQMIHLKHVPNQYRYLSGLLSIFKSKLNPTLTAPVGVTAHFFYKMKSWHPKYTYDSFPPEIFDEIQKPESIGNLNEAKTTSWARNQAFLHFLPFGSLDDPFLELEFVAGWPYLTEDVIVDSPSYSDLEPTNAPEWYFGLRPHLQAEFRLYDAADSFWKLQTDSRTIEEVLGKKLENSDLQYLSALDKLASANSPLPVPINRVINNVNRAQRQLLFSPTQYTDLPPLTSEQLETVLQFLFPDAATNPNFPYPSTFEFQPPDFQKKEFLAANLEGLLGVKSAPIGSLVWRLAIILSYVNMYVGYSSAVAHLWAEIVLEMRYRYERSILIPGLEVGSPNSGSCLLNQKLQMLNCCIEKKSLREKKENEKPSLSEIESPAEESEDEEDEFFDCDDTVPMDTSSTERMNKPVGRLRKNGRLRLLQTGEPMYIPITQDPAPLTEEVVEEQANRLLELGNDAEASELRAKMMSASLLSDMESFKAANPGALLDDFVRWYSPRDWIETSDLDDFGSPKGSLSARMKLPGNLWMDVWCSAQAVPARRQRRLFDDTREAEKVLHWLASRTLRDVSQLVFPCLIHAVTLRILEEIDNVSIDYKIASSLGNQVTQLTRCIVPSTSNTSINVDANDTNMNNYRSCVMSTIGRCEKEITELRSFQQKFGSLIDLDEIIKAKAIMQDLDRASEIELIPNFIKVDGGAKSPIGEIIKEIFHMEQARTQNEEPENEFKFGDPLRKVFILRYCPTKTTTSLDSQYNQEETLPQRMSCLLRKDEFLVAGTFSTKTELD